MIITKLLISVFVLFAISRLVMRFREGKVSNTGLVGWLLIWFTVETIILVPRVTSDIAQFLGIGRGADLIIYSSIIILFYLIFRIFISLEDIEREVTKIVQRDALKNVKKGKRKR